MSTFTPFSEQPSLHTHAPYRAASLTQPGNLRKALADAQADPSKALMGIAHGIPSTFLTKLIASTKPDFIWMDVEHGMFNRLTLHEYVYYLPPSHFTLSFAFFCFYFVEIGKGGEDE